MLYICTIGVKIVRVITGSARGRVLLTPEGLDTRPTADRIKHSIFNAIQFDVEGRRVLMCHGHLDHVGMGLGTIKQKARDMGANIVLFGHTHVPGNMDENGILFLNPGSLTSPRGGSARSYALLEIEKGKAAASVIEFSL